MFNPIMKEKSSEKKRKRSSKSKKNDRIEFY